MLACSDAGVAIDSQEVTRVCMREKVIAVAVCRRSLICRAVVGENERSGSGFGGWPKEMTVADIGSPA